VHSYVKPLLLVILFSAGLKVSTAIADDKAPPPAVMLKLVDVGATGIAIHRPVFAGACKACPLGCVGRSNETSNEAIWL
jgi:hypothetical protein